MAHKILPLVLLAGIFLSEQTEAGGCTASDRWRGPDKVLHAQAGAAVGFIGGMNNGDWREGVLWAAGVGALKEAVDATGGGQCSLQDFLITVAGGTIGATLGAQVSVWKTGQTVYVGLNFALR